MKKPIIIRADASSEIGLGHIIRCLALAQMLQDEYEISFACIQCPIEIEDDIINNGFRFYRILDESSFFSLLPFNTLVVLDHYGLDSDYQRRVKSFGCVLVCIDDLHDKVFYADLIINYAISIKASNYQAQSYTQFALGLDYVLLRPMFLEQAKKNRIINNIGTIFICFGGSDFNNLTQRVLKKVLEFEVFKKIIVVTGVSYNYINSLNHVVKNNSKVVSYSNISESNMLMLMTQSDVAIVPSSGILLEAICAGCFIISGMYTENQKYAFNAFKVQDVIVSAETFSEEAIGIAINEVLGRKVQQIKKIDGAQKNRLLAIIKSIY